MEVRARPVDASAVDVSWRPPTASGTSDAAGVGHSSAPQATIQYRLASGILRPRALVVAPVATPDGRLRARVSRLKRQAYQFRVSTAGGAWSEWTEAVTPSGDEEMHGRKVEEGEGGQRHESTPHERPAAAAAGVYSLPHPVLRAASSSELQIEWPAVLNVPPSATQLHVLCQPCNASEHVAGSLGLTATSASMSATRAWYRFRLKWADEWDFQVGAKGPWSERMYRVVTPGPPTLIRADPKQLVVQWAFPKESLEGVSEFELVLSSRTGATPSGDMEETLALAKPPAHTYHCVKHLQPCSSYKLRVRARFASGFNSPYSPVSDPMETLAPACALSMSLTSADSITIAWAAPSTGEDDVLWYQVEYTSTAGGHYQLLDRVPVANRESCVINGLWPATQYMFRVRAVRADGPDEWRNNWSRHFCTAAGTPAQKIDLLRQVSEESQKSFRSTDSSGAPLDDAECRVM